MGISTINFVRQIADLTKNNNAVLSNSDLTFLLPAGKGVSGSFWCPVNQAAASGVNFRLNVSSAPTVYLLNARFYRVQTNIVSPWALNALADFNDQLTASLNLNIVNGDFYIQANLQATVTMQFAQLSAVGANTDLMRGAFMTYIFN